MAVKKSELYSSLWASCDELRGGMDASQYKDYGLVLRFVKYASDKFAGQPYAPIRQLAEQGANPLPEITREVEALAAMVAGHLQKMGYKP